MIPSFTSSLLGNPRCSFGVTYAKHRSAMPADHRGADSGSDVVVTGRNVRSPAAPVCRTELRGKPPFPSPPAAESDPAVYGRGLRSSSAHRIPRQSSQLAQRLQLRKLRRIARIRNSIRAATRPPSEKLTSCFCRILQISSNQLVQEVLLVILHHHLGQNRASAAHNTRNPVLRQRTILNQHARVVSSYNPHPARPALRSLPDMISIVRSSMRRTRVSAS